ncbi:MAG: RagB/SusD family nutrient uptake outer membrane protein [Allomuricauda sp.]
MGCDDNLELEPAQSLTPEAVLTDEGNMQNLLIAAYDFAGQDEVLAGQTQLASELLANEGDLAWRGTFADPAEFNRKQMTSPNVFVETFWENSYAGINQVNIILDNLDIISDNTERNRIEGEAKFLRGTLYFELARFFALPYEAGGGNSQLGLPIVLEGVVDAGAITFPQRNSLEEVYDQAINDLNDAYSLLPSSNGVYADRYSAQGVLARLYLQQGNYTAARDAANDVLSNSGHSLAPTYAGAFNNDTDGVEDIFMWQITTQDGTNDFNTFWSTRDFGGRSITGDITVEAPYFDLFSDTDDRADFFYEGSGTILTAKWQSQFANIPYLRIAEMHLIRAESNFRLGTAIGLSPDDEINALRARSNAAPIAGLTLQDILDERKRELAFEGHALHDGKRLQLTIDGLAYNDDLLVFPIPQRELDANPNLQPNPGYNN